MIIREKNKKRGEFVSQQSGIALVEFAVTLPVLLLLFLGAVEICRYILITQKMENAVAMTTDVVTQFDPSTTPINNTTLQPIFDNVQQMMSPYIFGSNGIVILSDIKMSGGVPTIEWQRCSGGTLSVSSNLGSPGGTANFSSLPGGSFALADGDEILVGEIFYQFTPITTGNFIAAKVLYSTSVYVPRYGSLQSSPLTCP